MSGQMNRRTETKDCPVCGETYEVKNYSERKNIIFGSRKGKRPSPPDDALSILSNKESICVSFSEDSGITVYHH